MRALTTLLVVGMFLTTVAMADDVDDIKTAETAHFAALSAGDADAYVQHHLPENSGFSPDGGLLQQSLSLEEQKNNFQAEVDAGFKYNLQLRHLEVKVYGNTAVTTGYVVGTVTSPDGTTQQVTDRRTAVLIKQGDQWKEVHNHNSPVVLPQ